VNQISDFIPNSISAMPASTTRPASGPALGAFALALAVARGLSTPSQTAPSEVGSEDKPVTGSAGSLASLPGLAPALRNPQSKRLPNSDSLALALALASLNTAPGNAAVVNCTIVSGFTPGTAGQSPSLQPQQPTLLQPGLAPAPAGPVQVQTPGATPGAFQLSSRTIEFNSTPHSATLDYSVLNQIRPGQSTLNQTSLRQTGLNQTVSNPASTNQAAGSQTLANQTAVNETAANQTAASRAAPNQNIPNQIAMPNEDVPNASVPGQTIGSAAFSVSAEKAVNTFADPATQNGLIQSISGTAAAEAAPAEIMRASALSDTAFSSTDGQLASSTVVPIATRVSQESTLANEAGLGQVKPQVQAASPVDSAADATTLVASANPNADANANESPGARATRSLEANLLVADASSAIPPTPDATAQTHLSAQTAAESSLLGIAGQIPILSAPSLPASVAEPKESQPSPAGQSPAIRAAAAGAPGTRGASQGAEGQASPNSILTSALPTGALPTGSESANESQMAGQTPFSIFFSGPAPGVESAASVLPKMILPATSTAFRVIHINGIDVAGAGPQTSPQNSGLPSGIRQDLAPLGTKEVPSGSGSGNLQNTQPIRAESALSAAAGVQAVSPQSATAPALAPLASAGVTVPVSAPSVPPSGSRPQTAPSPTLAASVTAVPPPPEPAALGSVQVAQLVNRLGQSEMRIGLNTSAFGAVEVRTTVRTSDVGLVIGSEKGDLRTLLANDMPAIASTLQQQNLRLNSVNFMQGFAFSNNASGGGDPQQRSFVPPRASADSPPPETTPDDSAEPRLTRAWGGGSISILA
jgi:hypothetical protein